jgi:hypothetical protein
MCLRSASNVTTASKPASFVQPPEVDGGGNLGHHSILPGRRHELRHGYCQWCSRGPSPPVVEHFIQAACTLDSRPATPGGDVAIFWSPGWMVTVCWLRSLCTAHVAQLKFLDRCSGHELLSDDTDHVKGPG